MKIKATIYLMKVVLRDRLIDRFSWNSYPRPADAQSTHIYVYLCARQLSWTVRSSFIIEKVNQVLPTKSINVTLLQPKSSINWSHSVHNHALFRLDQDVSQIYKVNIFYVDDKNQLNDNWRIRAFNRIRSGSKCCTYERNARPTSMKSLQAPDWSRASSSSTVSPQCK